MGKWQQNTEKISHIFCLEVPVVPLWVHCRDLKGQTHLNKQHSASHYVQELLSEDSDLY